MEIDDLAGRLEVDGALLAGAVQRAGADAPVPSCPGWRVRDLVVHVGGVHRWAARHLREAPPGILAVDLDHPEGGWPPDGDLVPWFLAGCSGLLSALREADPAMSCATFLPAPSPRAFWARRQAHETAIHRADAELASGEVTPWLAPFAADGIDELLSCFIVRPHVPLRSTVPRRLGVVAADAAAAWTVTISEDPVTTVTGLGAGVDTVVTGAASDLYLQLWNRGRRPLQVEGDGAVLELLLDRVHVRW